MRLLSILFAPLSFFFRLLGRPLRLRARSRALKKGGWTELWLEGEVKEERTEPKLPAWIRRRLGREDEPRVALSRLRLFVDLFLEDSKSKGVLVRVGHLGGGWAAADAIREQLLRLRDADKHVIAYLADGASNRSYLVASAASRLVAPPTVTLAPVGAAASTLFMKDALQHAGVHFEVASAGRYKSAPEALTRTSRSEFDFEQTKALVDAVDGALVSAVAQSRGVDAEAAAALIDQTPLVATRAVEAGLIDDVARDEVLLTHVKALDGADEAPTLVGAGAYVGLRDLPSLIRRKYKRVGVVKVHGAIVERAGPYAGLMGHVALEKSVVADLRAALADKRIGAVILHVDSRGGGVVASDAIYSAVARVNEEKPVIACFADVAASGGYYVACGASKITASPLTVTGSIGVFSMIPNASALADRFDLHQDVVKNRSNADLYNLFRPRSEDEQAHADREVKAMYDSFVALVAEARNMTVEQVDEVAQGRVWTGTEAHARGLLDGLGGMKEAVVWAKEAAGGTFHRDPVGVSAKRRPMPRPKPFEPKALLAAFAPSMLVEMAALREASPNALAFAYAPLELR